MQNILLVFREDVFCFHLKIYFLKMANTITCTSDTILKIRTIEYGVGDIIPFLPILDGKKVKR